MDESKVSFKEQVIALSISGILFLVVYNLTGLYASRLAFVPSFVFQFESSIPFLPWMIIPYMTSGLFFILIFFVIRQKKELILFSKRIIFVTIISGICFILFPLKFSFQKPQVDTAFLNFFFQYLNTWDTHFNQAPSLHIAYACLFWSVLCGKLQGYCKFMVGVWIFLMGVSTLTIYQHHLIDVITALVLICITFFIFPKMN